MTSDDTRTFAEFPAAEGAARDPVTPRERYQARRAARRCVGCGISNTGPEARCDLCRWKAARSYKRRSPAAAAHRRAADRKRYAALKATAEGRAHLAQSGASARIARKLADVCLECSSAPAPGRERCHRHLRIARDRARARRAAAADRGAP